MAKPAKKPEVEKRVKPLLAPHLVYEMGEVLATANAVGDVARLVRYVRDYVKPDRKSQSPDKAAMACVFHGIDEQFSELNARLARITRDFIRLIDNTRGWKWYKKAAIDSMDVRQSDLYYLNGLRERMLVEDEKHPAPKETEGKHDGLEWTTISANIENGG